MYMKFVKSWFINCKCILMVHGGVSEYMIFSYIILVNVVLKRMIQYV